MANQKKDDKGKYIKTTISFEPEQYRQMISYCEREERSASWVIRKALAEWFEKHDGFLLISVLLVYTGVYW